MNAIYLIGGIYLLTTGHWIIGGFLIFWACVPDGDKQPVRS